MIDTSLISYCWLAEDADYEVAVVSDDDGDDANDTAYSSDDRFEDAWMIMLRMMFVDEADVVATVCVKSQLSAVKHSEGRLE